MSTPRVKRQFAGAASDPSQRHITSFFGKDVNGHPATNPSAAPSTATPYLSRPSPSAVPSHVQANLLSVGMRVRKSVPEGYKTGSLYSGFSLWADPNGPDRSEACGSSAAHESGPPSSRRELLPFCGIHKVGGLAAQPGFENAPLPAAAFDAPPSAADDFSSVPGVDDVPSLTSSQESVVSASDDHQPLPRISVAAAAPSSANRKRFFADDDEPSDVPTPFGMPHGLGVWRDRAEWLDGEVSPRSLAPAGWENARVMAVPKRRAKKGMAPGVVPGDYDGTSLPLVDVGQENMAIDDFGEAEFLDHQFAGEMDIE